MNAVRILLLIISIAFLTNVGFSQQIKWSTAINWKIYKVDEKKAFSYSLDSLTQMKSISLTSDTMNYFLKNAVEWPLEKYSLWMGLHLCTCEINGIIRKVEVSVYGGFFYDELTKRYYQVDLGLKDEWLKYINDNFIKLLN